MKRVRPYSLLYHSGDCLCVRLHPQAYFPMLSTRTPAGYAMSSARNPRPVLAFNANQFTPFGIGKHTTTIPKGICFNGDKQQTADLRGALTQPVLRVTSKGAVFITLGRENTGSRDAIAVQGGQMLVENGSVFAYQSSRYERAHPVCMGVVAIGVEASGHLLALHTLGWSCTQMASFMAEHGAQRAMLMDHRLPFLGFVPDADDYQKPISRGTTRTLPVTVEFVRF